jgi:carbon storage regulator
MLVLSRRLGEEIVIGDNIRVKLVAIQGHRVRLGVIAPKHVTVDRDEVQRQRLEFADQPHEADEALAAH